MVTVEAGLVEGGSFQSHYQPHYTASASSGVPILRNQRKQELRRAHMPWAQSMTQTANGPEDHEKRDEQSPGHNQGTRH